MRTAAGAIAIPCSTAVELEPYHCFQAAGKLGGWKVAPGDFLPIKESLYISGLQGTRNAVPSELTLKIDVRAPSLFFVATKLAHLFSLATVLQR